MVAYTLERSEDGPRFVLRRWSRPYDLRILKAASRAPFNVLHVCKRNDLLFEFADYPVRAFSWAATDASNPTLAQAIERLPGALMAGIDQERALLRDDSSEVLTQLERGFEQTGGRRWMVAPGCSIDPATKPANLRALRDAVESIMSHGRAP